VAAEIPQPIRETIQPLLCLIASLSEEIKCYEQKSNVWLERNISTPSYCGRGRPGSVDATIQFQRAPEKESGNDVDSN
jgi:hypothetical protein